MLTSSAKSPAFFPVPTSAQTISDNKECKDLVRLRQLSPICYEVLKNTVLLPETQSSEARRINATIELLQKAALHICWHQNPKEHYRVIATAGDLVSEHSFTIDEVLAYSLVGIDCIRFNDPCFALMRSGHIKGQDFTKIYELCRLNDNFYLFARAVPFIQANFISFHDILSQQVRIEADSNGCLTSLITREQFLEKSPSELRAISDSTIGSREKEALVKKGLFDAKEIETIKYEEYRVYFLLADLISWNIEGLTKERAKKYNHKQALQLHSLRFVIKAGLFTIDEALAIPRNHSFDFTYRNTLLELGYSKEQILAFSTDDAWRLSEAAPLIQKNKTTAEEALSWTPLQEDRLTALTELICEDYLPSVPYVLNLNDMQYNNLYYSQLLILAKLLSVEQALQLSEIERETLRGVGPRLIKLNDERMNFLLKNEIQDSKTDLPSPVIDIIIRYTR